jgi:hypothetical protein
MRATSVGQCAGDRRRDTGRQSERGEGGQHHRPLAERGHRCTAESSAAPAANGGVVFRGKSPVSGRKAAPGGEIEAVGAKIGFIAGVGCDGTNWSTGPANGGSPIFRTGFEGGPHSPLCGSEHGFGPCRTEDCADHFYSILHPAEEPLQRHTQAPRQPRQHMHAGNRLTAFDAADGIPRETTLQPQRIHAQLHAFPQFLMPTRQPLADALGVVVGRVISGSSHRFR